MPVVCWIDRSESKAFDDSNDFAAAGAGVDGVLGNGGEKSQKAMEERIFNVKNEMS